MLFAWQQPAAEVPTSNSMSMTRREMILLVLPFQPFQSNSVTEMEGFNSHLNMEQMNKASLLVLMFIGCCSPVSTSQDNVGHAESPPLHLHASALSIMSFTSK